MGAISSILDRVCGMGRKEGRPKRRNWDKPTYDVEVLGFGRANAPDVCNAAGEAIPVIGGKLDILDYSYICDGGAQLIFESSKCPPSKRAVVALWRESSMKMAPGTLLLSDSFDKSDVICSLCGWLSLIPEGISEVAVLLVDGTAKDIVGDNRKHLASIIRANLAENLIFDGTNLALSEALDPVCALADAGEDLFIKHPDALGIAHLHSVSFAPEVAARYGISIPDDRLAAVADAKMLKARQELGSAICALCSMSVPCRVEEVPGVIEWIESHVLAGLPLGITKADAGHSIVSALSLSHTVSPYADQIFELGGKRTSDLIDLNELSRIEKAKGMLDLARKTWDALILRGGHSIISPYVDTRSAREQLLEYGKGLGADLYVRAVLEGDMHSQDVVVLMTEEEQVSVWKSIAHKNHLEPMGMKLTA